MPDAPTTAADPLPFGLEWRPYVNDGWQLCLDGVMVAMVTKPFEHWTLITCPSMPNMRQYAPRSMEEGQRFAERWAVKHIDRLHAQVIATRQHPVGAIGPPRDHEQPSMPHRKKRAPRRGPRIG